MNILTSKLETNKRLGQLLWLDFSTSQSLYNWRTVSLGVEPFIWDPWPDFTVLSNHYEFSRHGQNNTRFKWIEFGPQGKHTWQTLIWSQLANGIMGFRKSRQFVPCLPHASSGLYWPNRRMHLSGPLYHSGSCRDLLRFCSTLLLSVAMVSIKSKEMYCLMFHLLPYSPSVVLFVLSVNRCFSVAWMCCCVFLQRFYYFLASENLCVCLHFVCCGLSIHFSSCHLVLLIVVMCSQQYGGSQFIIVFSYPKMDCLFL